MRRLTGVLWPIKKRGTMALIGLPKTWNGFIVRSKNHWKMPLKIRTKVYIFSTALIIKRFAELSNDYLLNHKGVCIYRDSDSRSVASDRADY